ncbi:MAG: zinc-ribbon domain containing protein, partial [Planctomycetota bacterium]
MDYFGKSCSENMPRHFFWECLHLDHDSAVRADVSRQNYSVCPRYWYVDATFRCSRCSETFKFTAAEQKRWYEELG